MKYHSPLRIVIIAFITLMVFLVVSLAAAYVFNIYSPTDLLVEKALEKLRGESGLELSFSSLERNIRGNITLDDVCLSVNSRCIVHVGRIRVSSSFFSIIMSLFTGGGLFNIDFISPSLSITDSDLEALVALLSNNEAGNDSAEPESAKEYIFNLHFYGLDAEYSSTIVSDAEVFLALSTREGLRSAEIRLDELFLSSGDFTLNLKGQEARLLKRDDHYRLSAGFSSLSLSYSDYSASLSDIALSAGLNGLDEISPDSINLDLSFSSGSLAYSDVFYSSIAASYISYSPDDITAAISLIVASYESFAISLSDLSLSYDQNSSDISFDSVNTVIYAGTKPAFSFSNTLIRTNSESLAGSLDIGVIDSYIISEYLNNVSSVSLKDVNAEFAYSEDIELLLASSVVLNSPDKLLDGSSASFDLSASYSVKESALKDMDASLSSIDFPTLDDYMNLNVLYENKGLELAFSYRDQISIRAEKRDEVRLYARLNELSLHDFAPLITSYFPFFEAYIGENTRLNGFLDATLDEDKASIYGYSGDFSYALGISEIRFMNFSFNLASSLSSAFSSDELSVNLFNITTDLVRISFTGSIDLHDFLPGGSLVIENTQSGNDYVNLELSLSENRIYEFMLAVPAFEEVFLSGIFNFEDKSHLYSNASLYMNTYNYDFLVDINFSTQQIRVENDNAEFFFSYGDEILSHLVFDYFVIPHTALRMDPIVLNGGINFSFDVAVQDLDASSYDFTIFNFYPFAGEPDITFSFTLDDQGFSLFNASLAGNSFSPMYGEALYLFDEKSFAFSLRSDDESISLSITPYEDYLTGLFLIENLNASRLRLAESRLNMSLSGRGADLDSLSFSGNFSLGGPSLNASAELYISSKEISITDFAYENGGLSLRTKEAFIDSTRGEIDIALSLRYTIERPASNFPVDIDMALSFDAEKGENLFSFASNLLENDFSFLSGRLDIYDLSINNTLNTGHRYTDISIENGNINFSGPLLTGSYSMNQMSLDASLDLLPITALSLRGRLGDDFYLDILIDDLSIAVANPFIILPVVIFTEDSLADARLTLLGGPGDFHLYGSVWSEKVDLEVFWLPGQRIIGHDMTFTVWDNAIESVTTAASSINTATGERKAHKVQLGFYLNENLGLDYYTLDVYIDEGNEVDYRLLMTAMNLEITGKTSGHLNLYQDESLVLLSGDLSAKDSVLSLGTLEVPDWFAVEAKTYMDFNVSLESNNSFVLSPGESPILTATIDENQRFRFTSDENGYGASGAISVRAGEIYYFQRSFFIREGDFVFRESDRSSFDPLINLRASLRTFDSDGEKVDIFLILRDSTLSNLNPVFESSPSKDLSEIMSILGQSIISSESSESNLGSVVSLLTTGMDVLQRFGVIRQQNSGLESAIRSSLNLDTFSLHTNIVGNLVYDAVLASTSESGLNVSPIARYLDGTALYIGKYIASDLYLEALAHLSARRNAEDEEGFSFISSDLLLDIEVSLEWESPICTFSVFTRPKSLTLDDVFKYTGISFSKRFVF